MKRLSSWPISAAIVLALGAVIASGGGCTTHGEGGRCDPGNVPAGTNQNADCDNGLSCISGQELELPDGGGHPSGYFCCPDNRQALAIGDICALNPSSPGSDASIGDGATESSTNDATTDQSTSDVVTDSPADVTSTDATDDGATTDAAGD